MTALLRIKEQARERMEAAILRYREEKTDAAHETALRAARDYVNVCFEVNAHEYIRRTRKEVEI